MYAAVESADPVALERAAHALKGIGGTVGAHEVGHLAVRLEEIGSQGSTQEAAQLVTELDSALTRTRAIFEHALDTQGPG